ncbi:MAG: AAA family ATPase [Pseudomonadota bacterium]
MTQIELGFRLSPSADNGRALIKLPSDVMDKLDLVPGDAVRVGVTGETHCRAVRTEGKDVELDRATATRIGAKTGGTVSISQAQLSPLTSAIVAVEAEGGRVRSEDLKEALFDLPLTPGDCLDLTLPVGGKSRVTVNETIPSPAGFLRSDTILSIAGTPSPGAEFEEIGGMEEEIARVHEMVAMPLNRPELFERLGVQPPKGVLFTGPPGSGKTLLARAVAARTSAAFFQINGPEIVSKHYGDSEAALRQVFDAASRKAPAIIFIDEIDAVAPRRDVLSGEKQVERRVVAQLLTLLDGMADRGRVVVMAATNLPDSIDPALRRPGRLEREITFRPPNRAQRRDILAVHLRDAPLAADTDLDAVADASHGFVGADLAALAREAALAALAREVANSGGEEHVDANALRIQARDLDAGLAKTRPALLRDTVVESPAVRWNDIGGHDDVKTALSEAAIWPVKHRDAFRRMRVATAKGILLSGPPGSGKTLLARALAGESGLNFVGVRPTRVLSQFLGEAERAVAELFAKARHAAPSLLFFDEFDALARRRSGQDAVLDRVVAQLLVEMDGLVSNEDVVVLAATNRPAAIDPALLRPGRIDQILSVPHPDAAGREAILRVHLANRPVCETVDLPGLAAMTSGMSGAGLAAAVQAAARRALRRAISQGGGRTDTSQIEADDITAAFADLQARGQELATDHLEPMQDTRA